MLQVIIVAVFFVAAFSLMALALHFAKWKKTSSSCCGGGNCDSNGGSHSCYSSKINYIDDKVLKSNPE
ncbi:MAG: hypothetical protein K9J16_06215 [Melioribacteraceae bacterium]|nr:hypothetical protein [Melioribacteraceae bacterium]MCF8355294.1 hypothetical protein [Melioribacteraceae bacterium]MCF8394140.1 hypothetical protein [Melioribacteraceae bacterium]MCF8418121.1 hypothetical protein [Melioribacteraceae bacterium]